MQLKVSCLQCTSGQLISAVVVGTGNMTRYSTKRHLDMKQISFTTMGRTVVHSQLLHCKWFVTCRNVSTERPRLHI